MATLVPVRRDLGNGPVPGMGGAMGEAELADATAQVPLGQLASIRPVAGPMVVRTEIAGRPTPPCQGTRRAWCSPAGSGSARCLRPSSETSSVPRKRLPASTHCPSGDQDAGNA